MNTTVRTIPRALLLLPMALGTAHATGFATDTELMRPTFSPDTVPGLETAKISGEGSYRAGVVMQYLREQLGLSDPIPVQYVRWIGELSRGDLGVSLRTGVPVTELLELSLPPTLELAAASYVIALVIGIPLGTIAGV